MELNLDKKKGWLLDDKPITSEDVMALLSHIAGRDKDKELELVADYWVMLKEPGHNGFWLKQYHKDTQNENEAIKK